MRWERIIVIIAMCMTALTLNDIQAQNAVGAKTDQSFLYEAQGRRDPFVPLIGEQIVSAQGADGKRTLVTFGDKVISVSLEGIMWDKSDPFAIVNDDVIQVGDELSGVLVKNITKRSLVLEYKGKQRVVKLIVE